MTMPVVKKETTLFGIFSAVLLTVGQSVGTVRVVVGLGLFSLLDVVVAIVI